MIYVGIDVASSKHDYFIVQGETGVPFRPKSITIPNSYEGFVKLTNDIDTFCFSVCDFDIRIGLESTGIYHKNILTFLVNNHYDVMLINPVLTNMSRKSSKVHHPKTDNIDSQNICKFMIDNQSSFKPCTILSYHAEALKILSRKRFDIAENLRLAKVELYNLIQTTFPEYFQFFSNIYGESSLAILSKYKLPSAISRAHRNTLASLIHGKCKCTAEDIINAAKSSIGLSDEYYVNLIEDSIDSIKSIQSRIDKFDSQIKKYVDEICPNILTISGVGYITAGLLLGEIRDINRFHSAESLVAYSGIDIETYQSGKYEAKNRYPSKKGSKYLRYALFQVAKVAWIHDPSLNAYYEKKKAEGKHFYVILGHLEKKLVRIIYSVLKSNKPYISMA